MKRTTLFLTSILTAGALALPMAVQANDADGQYGLIDHKMGIAPVQTSEAPVSLEVITPNPGTNMGSSLDQYGIADLKTGNAPSIRTSDGTASLPVPVLLKDSVGIAENSTDAMSKGAVITSDGGAIGTIDSVTPHAGHDTVVVRVSDNLKGANFSLFSIDVPKGAVHDDRLQLGWNMSDLIYTLRAQV